jgi:hypothetical protein
VKVTLLPPVVGPVAAPVSRGDRPAPVRVSLSMTLYDVPAIWSKALPEILWPPSPAKRQEFGGPFQLLLVSSVWVHTKEKKKIGGNIGAGSACFLGGA